jgi:8-oxo-dGTP pyrophosphatase MutT (NUDIX family)
MNTETNPWKIIAEKSVYENPWIGLTEFDVINPSGGKGIYGKVHFKNIAVGIVPFDEEMNTYLVGQYRFTINSYAWEIVEGGCPVGTDPLLSAQRELQEETGLTAKSWIRLLDTHLSNSVSDEAGIVYIARDLSQHEARPEETEKLAVKKVSFGEVYQMVMNGEITDSLSVMAILKIKLLQLNKQL